MDSIKKSDFAQNIEIQLQELARQRKELSRLTKEIRSAAIKRLLKARPLSIV